jgi:phage portal protein BeeE
MSGVLLGFSPVEAAATTILSSIAASRFGYQWFTEGTHPQAIIQNTESDLNAEQTRALVRRDVERWSKLVRDIGIKAE